MKVTFRSDSEPDFTCLERYLRDGSFGTLPDKWIHEAQQDLAVLQQVYEQLALRMTWITEEMRQKLGSFDDVLLPTHFDSPMQYRILDGLVVRIRKAADVLGFRTDNFPNYSCIPTGLVNASAVKLPGAHGSFLLCSLFANYWA